VREPMAQDAAFQKQIGRIGELVERLESSADPSSRALAKEFIESLMALHGAALERILELAAESGEPGEKLIRSCGGDGLIGSVLLLYGLHPESLQNRVTRALEKSRAFLESHAAHAELISIQEDGTVTVRLEMKSNGGGGCGSSGVLVKSTLEANLQNAAPDAATIVVEEAGALLMQSGFVSVAQLAAGNSTIPAHEAPVERSGD
jgi:Fe-S cluster biogenesis protein NfuA